MVVTSLRLSFGVSSAIRFVFLGLTCFIAVMYPHTSICFQISRAFFRAKSFCLRNLSLMTSVWKLSTVCNTVSIVHFYQKMLCLFQLKLPIAGMGNCFGSRATLRRPCLADRQTYLFVGTEFIAPDVLFKTTNAVALKKHRGWVIDR